MHNRTATWMSAFVLATSTLLLSAQTKTRAQAEKITHGPVVEGTSRDSASIAWTTDTGGSTIVRYGTDPNHLDKMAESPYADNEKTQAQNHRVHLKNLRPGTTYYYMVDSGQGEGTGTEAKSSVKSFKTPPR